jgi:hypothetical protein
VVSFTHWPLYPLGKEPPVPIGQELGWTPELIWMMWRSENSYPHQDSNSNPSVVQSVVSHYTDYTILAPYNPDDYNIKRNDALIPQPQSYQMSKVSSKIIITGHVSWKNARNYQ